MNDPNEPDHSIFIFDTTHYAMWAEELAQERRVPVEVVPAPPQADAKCGLALRTSASETDSLREAFDEKGIPYSILGEGVGEDSAGRGGEGAGG